MKPTNNIIKFLQTELTYDESVTARNCKDLGFGARKIKNVILDMRSKGINYLSQRKLESYR